MSAEKKIEAGEVHRCNKCGLCLAVCPVYGRTRQESLSPRAKVQLIKHYARRGLAPSPQLKEIVSQCLMCGSCSGGCPSGVAHGPLFRRMRSAMVGDFGQGWPKKAVYHFLSHERQLHMAAKFAQLGQKAALERLFEDFKLGNIPLKRMPRFNEQPFRDGFSGVHEPRGPVRGTLLYFTGCATNYVFGDIGKAVLKVLVRMGYRVEIPAGQECCGLPMALQGGSESARMNILRNVELLDREDVAAVVSDCATCGSALSAEYVPVLDELGEDTARARRLAAKSRDISQFLWAHRDELAPLFTGRNRPRKVTYHAPCHLRNHQGVLGQVEDLLTLLPAVDYFDFVTFIIALTT